MLNLRVKEIAEQQGLNISQLAEKAGLSRDTIMKYWYNQTQRYDRQTLAILAAALNVQSIDLLHEAA